MNPLIYTRHVCMSLLCFVAAPLKGIPSRVPTGGFRSPVLPSPNNPRAPLSRTSIGRKDGLIKLIDINEQPLGFAQAKKRKRMQGKKMPLVSSVHIPLEYHIRVSFHVIRSLGLSQSR